MNRKLEAVAGKPGLLIGLEKSRFEYRFPYYHDAACRLEGPGAYQVLQRFKRRWRNHPEASEESLLGASEGEPKEKPAPYPFVQVVGTYNSVDGKEKDRSLRDAYLEIIDGARRYIYIEDQYLVNLDVAKALNKKIRESAFSKLTFAIQDSIETSDIFIPNRKRGEFLTTLLDGTTQDQKDKVLIALFDRSRWDKDYYHPAMHAKTLIVDDELAIIGSANVNQRSFTIDSETSAIVFDDIPESSSKSKDNFARNFRVKTWEEFASKNTPRIMYESWWNYPTAIQGGEADLSILVKYVKDAQQDLDIRIQDFISANSVVVAIAAYNLLGQDLTKTSVMLDPFTYTTVFNQLWDNFVDPAAP